MFVEEHSWWWSIQKKCYMLLSAPKFKYRISTSIETFPTIPNSSLYPPNFTSINNEQDAIWTPLPPLLPSLTSPIHFEDCKNSTVKRSQLPFKMTHWFTYWLSITGVHIAVSSPWQVQSEIFLVLPPIIMHHREEEEEVEEEEEGVGILLS